jgi:MshEN domain
MSNPSVTTKKLGQMLVERGWITGEQLIRAIQSQRVVGGRIGTCLLEMDVLTEDKLLEALSSQLNVPSAQIEELRAIDRGILELVPAKVASRWQAVPLSFDRHELRVATLNVKNLACLDELEFCSNKRVRPHIANEVRIFEALERYYGIECPKRYGHLLDRLNRSRYLWDESAKILLGGAQAERGQSTKEPAPAAGNGRRQARLLRPPTSPSSVPSAAPARAGQPAARRDGAITWPVPARDNGSTGAETVDEASAPVDLALDDVERLLAEESDQKSIGRIILRFLGQSFSRCAIFSVHNDGVRGWLHHGESFDADAFQALDLKLDQPSAFLNLLKGSDYVLGPLPPMPSHRALARCWGGELPQECLMMPIRLRGRLISVLYGDRGALGLEGVPIEQIRDLSEKAAIAFQLCILRRKLQQKPAGQPRPDPD